MLCDVHTVIVSLSAGCPSTTSSQQCLTSEDTVTCSDHCKHAHKECRSMTLTCLSIRLYTFLLDHTFVKVREAVVVAGGVSVVASFIAVVVCKMCSL